MNIEYGFAFVLDDGSMLKLDDIYSSVGYSHNSPETNQEIVSKTYLDGDIAIGKPRYTSHSITFSNPVSMSILDFSRLKGLLVRATHMSIYDLDNDSEIGRQKIGAPKITLDTIAQDAVYTLTIDVLLLSGFFTKERSVLSEVIVSTGRVEIPIVHDSFFESTFSIEIETFAPTPNITIRASGGGRGLSISDPELGRSYYTMTIDTLTASLSVESNGDKHRVPNTVLTIYSNFFLLKPERDTIIVETRGRVHVNSIIVHERIYIA